MQNQYVEPIYIYIYSPSVYGFSRIYNDLSIKDQFNLMIDNLNEEQLRNALISMLNTDGIIAALVLTISTAAISISLDSSNENINVFGSTTNIFIDIYRLFMYLAMVVGGLGLIYIIHFIGEVSYSPKTKELLREIGLIGSMAAPVLAANISLHLIMIGFFILIGIICHYWVACICWPVYILFIHFLLKLCTLPSRAKYKLLLEVKSPIEKSTEMV